MNLRRAHSGFSLVELMIAMTLGLLLIAAVGALFYANKRNYDQNSMIAEMQANARFALRTLARDLSMAGFRGGLVDASLLYTDATATAALTSDCGTGADGQNGWAFDSAALEFINNAAISEATAAYPCLGAGEIEAGADLLTIRHSAGLATDRVDSPGQTPVLAPNTFYLSTNRSVGAVFFSGQPAASPSGGHLPAAPPISFWEHQSRLYFIRPYAKEAGDGIPTLCRSYLAGGASPGLAVECIARGVEDFQIAFGVDSDGDGSTDRYVTQPTRQQLASAITARLQLLMRAAQPDYGYTNDKSYDLLGADDDGDGQVDEAGEGYAPADHYYRRIVQTTILLNNHALPQVARP